METTTPNAVQKALLRGKHKQDPYHPFDWYANMRQTSPVHFDEASQTWSVFTYEEAKRVTIDKDTFSSQPPKDRMEAFLDENNGDDGPAQSHSHPLHCQQSLYTSSHEIVGAAYSRIDGRTHGRIRRKTRD